MISCWHCLTGTPQNNGIFMTDLILLILAGVLLLRLFHVLLKPGWRILAVLPAAAVLHGGAVAVGIPPAAAYAAVPWLLAAVFAAMMLLPSPVRGKGLFRSALGQLAYGQIVAWGQYPLSFGLFLLFLQGRMDPSFAMILPVGFEGGHGVAAAVGLLWEQAGWPDGGSLAMAMATLGLTGGLLTGLLLLRFAGIRGDGVAAPEPVRILPAAVLRAVLLLAAALLSARLLQSGIRFAVPDQGIGRLLHAVPLFPWALPAGWIVRRLTARRLPVSAPAVSAVSDNSLQLLVVLALAGLSWSGAGAVAGWLLLFFAAGLLWNLACLFLLAPRVLGPAWFARGIAEFGQSTGVTSAGLFLLRAADPHNRSGALQLFAAKQLFHEPLMGGGVWTFAAVGLTLHGSAGAVMLVSCAALLGWGAVLFYRNRRGIM